MTFRNIRLVVLLAATIAYASAINIKLSMIELKNQSNTICAMVGGCDYGCESLSTLPLTLIKRNSTGCNGLVAQFFSDTFDLVNGSASPSLNIMNTTIPCTLKGSAINSGSTTRRFHCVFPFSHHDHSPKNITSSVLPMVPSVSTSTIVSKTASATKSVISSATNSAMAFNTVSNTNVTAGNSTSTINVNCTNSASYSSGRPSGIRIQTKNYRHKCTQRTCQNKEHSAQSKKCCP
ncbi:hypothetical protein BDF20DRAFT_922191 [Mycotypha africana]|uniref:uncharacterized protein n=1 Tax=Mycotypha africana TaxID=64632 RepID=UPI002300000F|nr:uncharacterized protein BDF20DRAFT_922191 [Mycotypha africana]KAI8969918.1 hypothetical protein BDF20DRAFT_922191 [Mycotypha africana]